MVSAAACNERFKNRYGVYLRCSLLAALAFHFLLFYFFPAFEIKPYILLETEEFELVVPDMIKLPEMPREIAQPVPAILPSDDDACDEDIYIMPNVFKSVAEMPVVKNVADERSKVFYPFDEAPVLLKYVNPVYPELAMNAGIEGTVMLRVLVGSNGKVLEVGIIHSDVSAAMERSAVAAARQFVFRPAMQRTVAVRAYMAIPVRFRLQ